MSFLGANVTVTMEDPRAILNRIVAARILPAVRASQVIVIQEAQAYCPVDTGALRASIQALEPEDDGSRVVGLVVATMPYAPYVEFGTGIAGESSPGAGPGPYSTTWPGMESQPFLRPACDSARDAVMEAFQQ